MQAGAGLGREDQVEGAGEGGADRQRLGHAGTGAISARMARAAARGSGAAKIGRATTRWSAPAASAAAGVAMRFWSPAAEPAGRMPGVTMSLPSASGRARRRAASRGRGDDAVGAGGEGAAGALEDDVGEGAVADQGGVEVGAVERGEDGDGEDAGRGVAAACGGGGDHVRVAVDGEEVGGDGGGQAAGGGGDGGADVEELHVEEDPLAGGLELAGEVEAAAWRAGRGRSCRSATSSPRRRREGAGGGGVGQVEADDQAVIHGVLRLLAAAVARGGGRCQAPRAELAEVRGSRTSCRAGRSGSSGADHLQREFDRTPGAAVVAHRC